tara:strand:+ start:131 stop:268 length:138 start_codon:yes stop_codon:yes gene_type:complete
LKGGEGDLETGIFGKGAFEILNDDGIVLVSSGNLVIFSDFIGDVS